MPIYEYACDKCSHEFEVEQRITEDPVKTCPECRSRKVRRLISQTSFVLKGGGWYSDLYSSSKASADKDKGAADKDKGAAEDKGGPDKDGGGASASPDAKSKDSKADSKSKSDGGSSESKGKSGKGSKAAA